MIIFNFVEPPRGTRLPRLGHWSARPRTTHTRHKKAEMEVELVAVGHAVLQICKDRLTTARPPPSSHVRRVDQVIGKANQLQRKLSTHCWMQISVHSVATCIVWFSVCN